jgi:hypothetical protein
VQGESVEKTCEGVESEVRCEESVSAGNVDGILRTFRGRSSTESQRREGLGVLVI